MQYTSDYDRTAPDETFTSPKQKEGMTRFELASHAFLILTASVLFKQGLPSLLMKVIELHRENLSQIQVIFSRQFLEMAEQPPFIMGIEQQSAQKVLAVLRQIKDVKCIPDESGSRMNELSSVRYYLRHYCIEQNAIVLSCDLMLNLFLDETAEELKHGFHIMDVSPGGFLKKNGQDAVFQNPARAEKMLRSTGNFRGCVPEQGDIVRTEDGRFFQLGSQVGHIGAEGCVYHVSHTHCVKIFHFHHNTGEKIRKVRMLCKAYKILYENNPLLMRRIAFPEQIVYNSQMNPVGYLMRQFKGTVPLSNLTFQNVSCYIPDFSKSKQIAMALSLCELAVFASQNHLLLGDVLASCNILYDSHCNAFLIDMDSTEFTAGNLLYSAGTGHQNDFSPEHVSSEDVTFRRKPQDDAWALQLRLFFLLVFGYPYARKNPADNFSEDICMGRYPYQNGKSIRTDGITNRLFYDIMTHIPEFLREDFYQSFHRNGRHFRQENRLSVQHWFNDCMKYSRILAQMTSEDEESGKFMPNRRRIFP